ncbi:MAG: ABC transporter permease [Nocardioides sp.]|nr:ABC transporter permease [Nocardioides sp.]
MSDLAGAGPTSSTEPIREHERMRSLRGDAWHELRRRPVFWFSAALILLFVMMAIAPGLFTDTDPRLAVLAEAREAPSSEHWFGRDVQGYDLYSRCVHGARASILVGLAAAVGTALIGSTLGLIAGYAHGVADAVVSRFADLFFALPMILGAIIILTSLPEPDSYVMVIFQVVVVFWVLGWPSIFRLMRASVLQVAPNDYVQAARALGASPLHVVRTHILPNAVGPVLVVSTINLGVFIVVEASLSFLGIGLRAPTVSWGVMIDDALGVMRTAPHVLLFPALFLSLTVLGFIMLGDAIRDALDPRSR